MRMIRTLCAVLTAIYLLSGSVLAAQGTKNAHQEIQNGLLETRGPHGGLLLQQDDVSVELLIFEQGVPPEYRAWIMKNSQQVIENANLKVELTRLGGQKDIFDFTFDGDYWLGQGVVAEPHSFDVSVMLNYKGRNYHWQWESYEGRTQIATDTAEKAGIQTAKAGPGVIEQTVKTYGLLTTALDRVSQVRARFPGVVIRVTANLGDLVSQGDAVAEVESNESLQTYVVRAPIDGVITERHINGGEVTGETALFAITDLSTLWAELRVFPGQRREVAVGQTVRVTADGIDRQGTVRHLLPAGDDTPYILARVGVDNSDGLLTPGLLVAGDLVVDTVEVPLAVDNRALQSFRDWTVVFIQVGDTYEIRPLELGRSDGEITEVLSGLQPGDRYVVENSYLIKADLEKSGASHDH